LLKSFSLSLFNEAKEATTSAVLTQLRDRERPWGIRVESSKKHFKPFLRNS